MTKIELAAIRKRWINPGGVIFVDSVTVKQAIDDITALLAALDDKCQHFWIQGTEQYDNETIVGRTVCFICGTFKSQDRA